MVFSPNDCHGLKRLLGGSGGSGGSSGGSSSGSDIMFVPKGTNQQLLEVTEVGITIAAATASPVARMLTILNESVEKTTVFISVGSPASLGNYLYPLRQHLILEEVLDGGEIWSAITQSGEIGILRVSITPLVKIF